LLARIDLPVWEVFAAVRRNSPAALTNRTIWVLAAAQPGDVECVNGLAPVAIARVLCNEARLRGLAVRNSREEFSQ
jgi:hypothetical protein